MLLILSVCFCYFICLYCSCYLFVLLMLSVRVAHAINLCCSCYLFVLSILFICIAHVIYFCWCYLFMFLMSFNENQISKDKILIYSEVRNFYYSIIKFRKAYLITEFLGLHARTLFISVCTVADSNLILSFETVLVTVEWIFRTILVNNIGNSIWNQQQAYDN